MLNVLLVEDSEDDAILVTHALRASAESISFDRVDSEAGLRDALAQRNWDAVVSDYSIPGFGGLEALRIVRSHAPDLPFVMVSATIGEDIAVEAMRTGASDYVMKSNLARLLPALQRELREACARKESRRTIEYLAYHDVPTGLANRALFMERVRQYINSAREGEQLALIVMQVCRIDVVEESLGRPASDSLAARLGTRLGEAVADHGRIARVAPDRFGVIVPDLRRSEEAGRAVVELMRRCSAAPVELEGTAYHANIRAGIALHPGDGDSAEKLLQHAEAAAARATRSTDPYLFYAEQMTARVAHELRLEACLRRAFERNEFRLHYQPKVDVRTRRIVGCEALMRWRSDDLGNVPPVEFIPRLEECGLIVDVGSWALRQAACDGEALRSRGLEPGRIAVNVSARQLREHDFVATATRALDAVPDPSVDVELTESSIMDDVGECVRKLRELRASGVKIAIDDFGTGYSSLSYLARLPIQTLKIDRSFVSSMLDDAASRSLVGTIVTLAKGLGLATVAEGVEAMEQVEVLESMGCDEIQGYVFSPPVPLEDLAVVLARDSPGGNRRSA